MHLTQLSKLKIFSLSLHPSLPKFSSKYLKLSSSFCALIGGILLASNTPMGG
jgi:hypothetical protein